MKLCGVRLKMSTSRHPQTDGSSEIMNRMLENYLRCYCNVYQTNWDELLTAAEFAYNSAKVASTGMTPFEMDLGWNPKSPLDLLSKADSSVEDVNSFRKQLTEAFEHAKFAHRLSRARYASYNSNLRQPIQYNIGDLVWLSRTVFVDALSKHQPSEKLAAKRFGPFKIIQLIGKNAVRLDLPSHIRVHPVVHVEHTKRFYPQPSDISHQMTQPQAPIITADGSPEYVVDKIIAHRKRGKGFQWLTQMIGELQHDAIWQPTKDFIDSDGTVTRALLDYVTSNNLIVPMLSRSTTEGRGNGERGNSHKL